MKAKIAAGIISAVLLGGTGTAVALSEAPAARADEQSYLNQLANEGFTGPAGVWLHLGYTACEMAARGATQGYIFDWMYRNTGDTVTVPAAREAVILAEIYLC